MDVLSSTPDDIPIVEAAALLEEGHWDLNTVEMKNREDKTGDNHNKIQQTENCVAHVIELIGCRDEESFRSRLNLTSAADLALLEPNSDCCDLFPDDILARRRFWQIVTFVKNGNVITLNTTMADIIRINKKHRDSCVNCLAMFSPFFIFYFLIWLFFL
jgi:hypothetical protein